MKHLIGAVILVVACAASASAQTGLPTFWTIQAHLAGTPNPTLATTVPFKTMSLAYNPADCGKPLFATAPLAIEVNAKNLIWTDPVNPALLCVTPATTTQIAFMSPPNLPFAGSATVAGYVFTMTAMNADGTSARTLSANALAVVAPPNPPAAPAGFQVRP